MNTRIQHDLPTRGSSLDFGRAQAGWTSRAVAMLLLAALAISVVPAAAAMAADDLDALKARMKERYPALRKAQDEGKVGETFAGFVEAVKADNAGDALVRDENADRTAVYKILAQREGTSPSHVGQVAGKRNFERARPGHFLKTAEGKWIQKQ